MNGRADAGGSAAGFPGLKMAGTRDVGIELRKCPVAWPGIYVPATTELLQMGYGCFSKNLLFDDFGGTGIWRSASGN